jgi:hypothetical protein
VNPRTKLINNIITKQMTNCSKFRIRRSIIARYYIIGPYPLSNVFSSEGSE